MSKNILKLLVFCFTLVFILSFLSIAYAQDTTAQDTTYELTPKDKMILTEPAICYITTYYYAYVYNPNTMSWSEQYPYPHGGGTGFCVNPDTGHIFTAGHVVDAPYDDIKWAILDEYIYNYYPDEYYDLTDENWNWIFNNYKVEGENGPDPDRDIWVQFNTATAGLPDNPNENYIRAEFIGSSPWEQRDLAVIKITPVTGNALSSIIIGDSSMIEVQDNITIIGYPWNADISLESVMTPTYASGIVSARKMVGGTEVLQVDMTAAPGNSGSPVLNENGEVIGMLTMGSSENVNFLRPSNDIKDMLNKNGVTNKLGMLDEEFEKGIVMYGGKHYSLAINNFNAILNLSQRHIKAQEYRAKAQEAVSKGEDVPLVEEKIEEPPIEEEKIQEVPEKEMSETKESESWLAALGLKIIILAIVLPILFVIIIVVVVVVLVKRRSAPTKTETPKAAPTIKEEKPK
ncbi:MAG: serine protease, partial [Actinobacteria bacterium]|nr:serine protease [Actinomycetota bacterium]